MLAQEAAGVSGADHLGIGRGMGVCGAVADEDVQVGGCQGAGLGGGEELVGPYRAGAVDLGRGRGDRAHRREQAAVGGAGEVLGLERADGLQAVGYQEQGAEQGLLGVVDHRQGRRIAEGLLLGCGAGVVGHHAARTKSSRLSMRSTCGAIKCPASSGGTALPIWEKRWPLVPCQG